MKMRRALIVAAIIWATLAVSVFAAERRGVSGQNGDWVGTWACSPQLAEPANAPPEPGFADSTLRQIVHVSIGGQQIRVRFSNAFGATALTIPSAHVAVAAGEGAIRPDSDYALTFHGQPSVTIPAGALTYSDPLDFALAPLSDLAITIRLNGTPEGFTAHPGSRATSYLVAGDFVAAAELSKAVHVDHWYYVNGVDVLTGDRGAAIVTLGDSITDGSHSTTNGNGRWPDDLARRLHANKKTANIAVLNEGIGGNRLLLDGLGPNALARFDRDVLAQVGVRWLIVLEGVNDLGTRDVTPQTKATDQNDPAALAERLIAALDQIIVRAHSHGILVYGVTILPFEGAFYFTPEGEANRQTINNWIRTSGRFDAVIDMDATVRDPQHPARFSETVDSGDHLHPGDAGYKIMSDSIDLKLFTKRR
jgi:lysophospholipase L1-like esterase